MLPMQAFLTHTLARHPHGAAILRILAAALQAVEPGTAVQRFVQRQGSNLSIDGQQYPLANTGRMRILGLGKAATAMAQPLADLLVDFAPRGLLIPKHVPRQSISGFEISPGDHPVPDENSLRAGQKAIELVSGLRETDLLLCLISGGGSALMAAPPAPLTLADLQALTSALLACGARIDEINTLRRRLDQLKGGGLAKLAAPARVASLILSDVVNNPLEAIASGPTAPDPATQDVALAVITRYGLEDKIPASILEALRSLPETPKPGDPLFANVQNVLVGSNLLAAQAAESQANLEGFTTHLLGNDWQGEAREVAQRLCARLKNAPEKRPCCLIAGGETTVTLRGNGQGGRNQELALATVTELADMPNTLLVTLATDGEDGPTDAAGAVVTDMTLQQGHALGLDPHVFLDNNNAYHYFQPLGDLLKPGPSGTNVNDLTFLFHF
jgi:glycerate 2-kinase